MNEQHWSRHLFPDDVPFSVWRGWDDPYASYSFDMKDIALVNGKWYLVGTSGCSCPSYEDNADIDLGPFDNLDALEDDFLAEYDNDKVGNYYRETVPDILKAIDNARLEVYG